MITCSPTASWWYRRAGAQIRSWASAGRPSQSEASTETSLSRRSRATRERLSAVSTIEHQHRAITRYIDGDWVDQRRGMAARSSPPGNSPRHRGVAGRTPVRSRRRAVRVRSPVDQPGRRRGCSLAPQPAVRAISTHTPPPCRAHMSNGSNGTLLGHFVSTGGPPAIRSKDRKPRMAPRANATTR